MRMHVNAATLSMDAVLEGGRGSSLLGGLGNIYRILRRTMTPSCGQSLSIAAGHHTARD